MRTQRLPVSFRFPIEFIQLLDDLKAKTGLSLTSIIIVAVREYAKKEGVG